MNGSFAQSAAVEARIPCRTAQGREGEFEVSETCRSTSLERWATGVDRIAAARWVQAERLLRPKSRRLHFETPMKKAPS